MQPGPGPQTQTPVFVLSSGRSGSTLLARLIHRHPQLLCISDLFEPVGEIPYFDRTSLVSGEEFLAILSRPSFPQRIAYWRQQPTDELLFLPDDDNLVSLLLSYTLAFLTNHQPMALFAELEAACAAYPEDVMANHLLRFFDWLRDRFSSQLWVERTGGSLPHTEKILATWPDAKIVHNFRDPRETALSMMTGSFFRLYLELEKNPDLGDWDWSVMPPIEEMGTMLNRWFVNALNALEQFPGDRQMNLAFEDLQSDPRATLLGLSGFLFDRPGRPTAEDLAWAEGACSIIRKPPKRFPNLSPDDQKKLQRACSESAHRLGYSSLP